MLKFQHKAFLIDGFLFSDFRYGIGRKIVCFPGCFAFAVFVVVVIAVAVFVVAVGAASVVVVAAVAGDINGE